MTTPEPRYLLVWVITHSSGHICWKFFEYVSRCPNREGDVPHGLGVEQCAAEVAEHATGEALLGSTECSREPPVAADLAAPPELDAVDERPSGVTQPQRPALHALTFTKRTDVRAEEPLGTLVRDELELYVPASGIVVVTDGVDPGEALPPATVVPGGLQGLLEVFEALSDLSVGGRELVSPAQADEDP